MSLLKRDKIICCIKQKKKLFAAPFFLFFFLFSTNIFATPISWDGGTESWGTAANWTPDQVPVSGDDITVGGFDDQVNISGARAVGNITLSGLGATIALPNGTSLTVDGGATIGGGGDIQLSSSGNATSLIIAGDVTLDNGTDIIFSSTNIQNRITGSVATNRFTINGEITSNAGQIGVNSMLLTVGSTGLIDGKAGATTIDLGAGGTNYNLGMIRQEGGIGSLTITGSSIDNTDGEIQSGFVSDNATINITSSAISGGTLRNLTAGSVMNFSVGTLTNLTLDGVGGGSFKQANTTSNTMSGTITGTNSPTWEMNAVGNSTDLRFADGTTLSGLTITMSNSINNRIFGSVSTDVATFESTTTIEGAGQLLANSGGAILRGLVDANVSSSLTIDPSTAGATNKGTIQASNGGLAILTGGVFTNFEGATNGTVQALAGSRVEVNGSSTINGGVVQTVGTGTLELNSSDISATTITNSATGIIRADSGTTNVIGATTFTNNGILQVNNNTFLAVDTDVINNGTIQINSTGNDTRLRTGASSVTLTGGGMLTLGDSASRLDASTTGNRLVNTNNEINGAGVFGYLDTLDFTNQASGVVDGDDAGGAILVLNPRSVADSFINFGTIKESGSGNTRIDAGNLTNKSTGLIQGVDLNGVSIAGEGGTLNNVTQIATGTLTGTHTITGTYNQNNAAVTVAEGTITNSGTYNQNSTGNATELQLSANLTLTGTGVFNQGTNVANRITRSTGTPTLTNDTNHSITGGGQLGMNLILLDNKGTINSNVSGVTKTVDLAGTSTNTGTMKSSNGATLTITGSTITNTGGTIKAETGSTTAITSSTISGGTLDTDGTGIMTASASTLTSVTNTGEIDVNNGTTTTIATAITNNGNIDLNSAGFATILLFNTNNATLGGTGAVNLGTHSANRLYTTTSGDRIIQESGHTINLAGGNLLFNTANMTNNGNIIVTGTATIDPQADLTIGTTGLLKATGASAVITFGAGSYVNNGIIELENGATATIPVYTGTGGLTADNATISLGANTYGSSGATGAITVQNGGALNLTGSTLYGGSFTADTTSSISVASELILSGDFLPQMTDPADFTFDNPTSGLQMVGGVGVTNGDYANYKKLEVVGQNFGTTSFDPSNYPATPVPNASGYVDWSITNLTIGPGAHVRLVDLYNNATVGGLGDEALYVDTLTIDLTSRFSLNELPFYFNNLVFTGGATPGDIPNIFNLAETNTNNGFQDNNSPLSLLSGLVEFLWTDITVNGNTTASATSASSELAAALNAIGATLVPGVSLLDVSSTATFTGDVTVTFSLDGATLPNGFTGANVFGIDDNGSTILFIATTFNAGENTVTFTVPGFSDIGIGVNPEPATLFLLGSALLGLWPLRKKFLK